MRLVALSCALVVGLAWMVVAARATTSDPRYDRASSIIAGRTAAAPTHVLCYQPGEPGDPDTAFGAWGYVDSRDLADVNLAAQPCEGLRGIVDHDPAVPLWEEALGVLVLTHESYHQNYHLFPVSRTNEALTECRAIRAFHGVVSLLGGTDALAEQLYPYAAAFHYREEYMFPEYGLRDCRLPWWWK